MTLLIRFCRRQNLRHLFSVVSLPPSLSRLIPSFLKRFSSDIRGTLLNDMLAQEDPTTEDVQRERQEPRASEYVSLFPEVEDALR